MFFNEVMALVMPAIIGLFFYSKLIRKNPSFFDGFCYLVLFLMLTNCLCYGILIFLRNTVAFVFTESFTLEYSVMATLIALVMAIIVRFVELNVKVRLRVESADEEK